MNGFVALRELLATVPLQLTGLTPDLAAVSRYVIVLAFLWSGLFKLRAPRIAALAIVNFGLARTVRPNLGWLAGLFEVSVAVALALGLPAAAAAASVTLWFFTALLVAQVRRGSTLPCYCFGDDEEPLGRLTLLRTAGLATLATVLTLRGPAPQSLAADLLAINVASALVSGVALIGALARVRALERHDHRIERLAA